MKIATNESLMEQETFWSELLRGTTAVLTYEDRLDASNMAMVMASHIASGRSSAPFYVLKPMKVVIINVEDPADAIARRRDALNKLYQWTETERHNLDTNLIIFPGRDVIGPLMRVVNGNPARTEYFDWLQRLIDQDQPSLIIYDSKSGLYGLDENSEEHALLWWSEIQSTQKPANPPCSHMVLCPIPTNP